VQYPGIHQKGLRKSIVGTYHLCNVEYESTSCNIFIIYALFNGIIIISDYDKMISE
jgi:hypothetical protein